MSILSTVFSFGKTAVGFLTPAGSALKLAPWAIAGVLATALVIEHYRLVAADAGIKTAQAQTAQTVQKCQAEASAAAAAQDAATVQAIQQAQAQANAAEAQLQAEFKASQGTAAAMATTITTDAAQPSQDAPPAPVLLHLDQALEAAP